MLTLLLLYSVVTAYNRLEAVIGTSHDLTSVFTKMSVKLELVEKGQLTPKHRGSDQELMARVNLDSMKKGGPQAVLGDDQMMLFQVVTFSYKDLIFQTVVETIPDTKEAQHEPLRNLLREEAQWANRSIAYNHISHTIPPLLHFPGPRKPKNWWKLMWWMQPLKHSNCTSPQCLKQERTPAELFYAILESRTDEASGYGAKLPDGTWLSYMDLCGPFKQTMLK